MPKKIIAPTTFRYVAFYDLIADAAFQHSLARVHTDSFSVSRHARASIVAAAFSVECVANCLIGDMDASKSLRDELDKLPPLPKIETALRMKGISTFDRGRNEVQAAVELVRIRNDYVHPKTTTSGAEAHEPEDAGVEWKVPFIVEAELWRTLVIPKQAMVWTSEASLSVLKALCGFFRYLFVDILKANRHDLDMLLQSRLQIGSTLMPAVFDEIRAAIGAIRNEGVDFSFLLAPLEPTKTSDAGAA